MGVKNQLFILVRHYLAIVSAASELFSFNPDFCIFLVSLCSGGHQEEIDHQECFSLLPGIFLTV